MKKPINRNNPVRNHKGRIRKIESSRTRKDNRIKIIRMTSRHRRLVNKRNRKRNILILLKNNRQNKVTKSLEKRKSKMPVIPKTLNRQSNSWNRLCRLKRMI